MSAKMSDKSPLPCMSGSGLIVLITFVSCDVRYGHMRLLSEKVFVQ